MKKTKEIQAGGFYLFVGKSSANSTFIRDIEEAKVFLQTAENRFKNYLGIKDYYLTQDSWMLLCEVEIEETILSTYNLAREKSKRALLGRGFTEVWRIISEQYRHFLSWFVKYSNYKVGRTGGLVHSSFERYYFDSHEEAVGYIDSMRNQAHRISQVKREFRPSEEEWEVEEIVSKGNIYLCTKQLVDGKLSEIWSGTFQLISISTDVLRKVVNHTKNIHNPIFKPIPISQT